MDRCRQPKPGLEVFASLTIEKKMKQGLKIVFEDDWLIVVEKPSGLLTMATDKGREVTAYSMLFDYVCECAQQNGSMPTRG